MFFSLSKKNLRQKTSGYLSYIYKKNIRRPLESLWSCITSALAFLCLLLIFSYTPVVTTTQSLISYSFKHEYPSVNKTFAFIPGSTPSKFDQIDLNNLNMISFYDLPYDTEGSVVIESDGYNTFQNDNTYYLIQSAQEKGVKVLAAFTQTYNPDILEFLEDHQAQQNIYVQAAQIITDYGLDGITLNVEFTGDTSPAYKDKFTNYVKGFTAYLHDKIPGSLVTIAIPDNYSNDSIYNVRELASLTDNILIVAYSYAVPEVNNNELTAPRFGGDYKKFEENLKTVEHKFTDSASYDKLVLERAWYGNADNYRLYSQDFESNTADLSIDNSINEPISAYTINNLIADVPYKAQNAARRNLPFIIEALKNENILNANVLAYALATIQHETAGTFEPIEEYKGRKSARRLGYEGGTNYFGRGFIQLTHLRNYEKIGNRIGIGDSLVKNPALATQPDIAAKVLAAYFKDFGIAEEAANGNFIAARTLINPDYNGYMIAQIAYVFLNAFV